MINKKLYIPFYEKLIRITSLSFELEDQFFQITYYKNKPIIKDLFFKNIEIKAKDLIIKHLSQRDECLNENLEYVGFFKVEYIDCLTGEVKELEMQNIKPWA